MTAQAPDTSYTANSLTVLEGLQAVRKRPGMYIGSTDSKGLTHLVYEIVDNAVDEALAGHCKNIVVTLYADGSAQVEDDGRGIPTGIHTQTGLTGVELALTKLHGGGKFGGSGYKSAGGLHGVGASVVNALSVRTDATVVQHGKVHQVSFSRGPAGEFSGDGPQAPFLPRAGLRITGKATKARPSGTTIRFWPDMPLFKDEKADGARIDTDAVAGRLRRTAFLVPGLNITVHDLTGPEPSTETFCFAGGIADLVDANARDAAVTDTVMLHGTGSFKSSEQVLNDKGHMSTQVIDKSVEVSVAFRWGTGYDKRVESFVNVVHTPNGGTHVKGFERAFLRVVNEQMKATRVLKAADDPVLLDDITEGLTAVVYVNIPEPEFIGQTKDELGTNGAAKIVAEVVTAGLKDWAEARKTKNQARVVWEKVSAAAKTRLIQRQQKDASRRKTALEGASMPAKLVDCRSTQTDRTELWICEGDSAVGTARLARSSEFQALLPIRGKILNVQKAGMGEVLANAECSAIIQVIGAGSGRTFDLAQMRYQRIVMAADADVDGSHIRCLLITLFARYMRPVIEAGRLFTAVPPFHKIEVGGKSPETLYTYSQAEMERTVARLGKAGRNVKNVSRYKGLGEMNPTEFRDTTMNPATRAVRRIMIADLAAAEARLELLMGEDVGPRRDWIIEQSDKIDKELLDA